MTSIKLIKLKQEHFKLLFKWSNLKSVIKNSLKKKNIKYNEHKKWFSKQIKSKNIIKIIYYKKMAIGVIRLEKKNYNYFISYLIIPSHRKKGFAYQALKHILFNKKIKNIKKLVAIVKKDNIPSIKIFSKLKFRQIGKLKDKKLVKFEYII